MKLIQIFITFFVENKQKHDNVKDKEYFKENCKKVSHFNLRMIAKAKN